MKKPAPDNSNDAWLANFMSGTSAEAKTPAFRTLQSPAERKASETTRAFREMTEAATNERQATTAKLRAARLARDAEAGALPAQKPPKTKKGG